MIVNEISKIKPNAIHLSTKKDVLAYLRKSVISNELIMTMGAGDVYEWHKEIKAIYERS
jgi:UDP-N-acetylmuramate-alanine ligase